jgi:thioesterase domain-containing protein
VSPIDASAHARGLLQEEGVLTCGDRGEAAHILQQAAAIGVLAEDADRAQILRLFEAYLANGIALQTYLPEPDDLDLLLLRAAQEPADYGPQLGWEALIKGSLETVDVSGDHNSVMYPPHAAVAARAIAHHLATDSGEQTDHDQR